MADTKISALTGIASGILADADELPVADASDLTLTYMVTALQMKTYMQTATAPSIISVGAEFTSTGIPTATLPGTHTTNDILVLCIQQSNEAIYAVPAGYARLGPSNGIGTAVTAGATKLSLFWKRDNGSEVAPTLTDSGDHTYGVMFAVRGCPTVGNPFVFGGNNWKFTTSTAGSGPKSVTAGSNRLVVDIFATSIDNAGAQGSSLTNASLTSLTEQFDDGTTDGTGGGIYISSGIAAAASEIVATTVTWANTSVDVCTRLHFIPKDDNPPHTERGPETQIFIGSRTDIDDTWVKPYGARRVFVQTCDGGGSGSGGNITTTAAGGGGGGGGGYNEASFDALTLAATITVHCGKGGNIGTALNAGGNQGNLSEFDKGGTGPLTTTYRIQGTPATGAASADGGNGGCGGGGGNVSPTVTTTRISMDQAVAGVALGSVGGRGGSGTTAPVGGSTADWGGGGGESGGDTDAAINSAGNGWSLRGGGGGAGGRTNTLISGSGHGGGAVGVNSAQGASGGDSSHLPYGGSGGCAGGSTVATGGNGGFPGGGGGGGGGVAGGFGGSGGHGCVVVTTFF